MQPIEREARSIAERIGEVFSSEPADLDQLLDRAIRSRGIHFEEGARSPRIDGVKGFRFSLHNGHYRAAVDFDLAVIFCAASLSYAAGTLLYSEIALSTAFALFAYLVLCLSILWLRPPSRLNWFFPIARLQYSRWRRRKKTMIDPMSREGLSMIVEQLRQDCVADRDDVHARILSIHSRVADEMDRVAILEKKLHLDHAQTTNLDERERELMVARKSILQDLRARHDATLASLKESLERLAVETKRQLNEIDRVEAILVVGREFDEVVSAEDRAILLEIEAKAIGQRVSEISRSAASTSSTLRAIADAAEAEARAPLELLAGPDGNL